MLIFMIPLIVVVALICLWIYFNTGLKGFEKEVSKFALPENVEKIALKSGIGDSGGRRADTAVFRPCCGYDQRYCGGHADRSGVPGISRRP